MPLTWKVGLVVLVLCLLASMAIAAVRLATTPTEVLGGGFRDLPARQVEAPGVGSTPNAMERR